MKPTRLFYGLEEFQQYADGLVADTTYEQLAPSIRKVTLAILPVITRGVYDELSSSHGDDAADGLELLKTVVATGALLEYQIFASTKRNGTDASLYKYQHEEIKDHYREAHWTAMDRLLDWLDEHPTVGGWQDSAEYRARQALPVRSGTEFDRYYGIGASAFFYHKVLFLVRQVWGRDLQPLLPQVPSDKILESAKQALCYKVVALVVMQFDVTELPRSLRYDFNHEYTKGSQMQGRDRLYNQLMAHYTSLVAGIERSKAVSAGTTVVSSGHNSEDSKYYGVL